MLTTSTYDYAFATKSNVIFKEARYDFGGQNAKTRDSYLMIILKYLESSLTTNGVAIFI